MGYLQTEWRPVAPVGCEAFLTLATHGCECEDCVHDTDVSPEL